jgi:hypothetical protein
VKPVVPLRFRVFFIHRWARTRHSVPRTQPGPRHGDLAIHIVVDPDFSLARVQAVKPTGVLHESALPGDGHSQEQGIEPRVVESFADVAAGGEDESRLVVRVADGRQRPLSSTLAGREVDGDHDEVPEGAGPEQRPVVSANARRFCAQDLEHPVELTEGRLLRGSHQRVGEGDQ